MTTVNRILTVLVFGTVGVLAWALVAHTDWAATRSLLAVGDAYQSPVTPIIEIAGTVMIAVAVTKLTRQFAAWFSTRVLGRTSRLRIPIGRSAGSV